MIRAIFEFGGKRIRAEAISNVVLFYDEEGHMLGFQLSYDGVCKEYPDLKNDPEWKRKAIEREMDIIKNLPNENARIDYVIAELRKIGYKPLVKQRDGFRPERLQ